MALFPTTGLQSTKTTLKNVETKPINEFARVYRVDLAGSDVSSATSTDDIKIVPVFAGEAITRGWVNVVSASTTGSSVFGLSLGSGQTGNLTGAAKTTAATATGYTALSGAGLGALQTSDTFVTLCHGTTKPLNGVIEVVIFVAEVAPQ